MEYPRLLNSTNNFTNNREHLSIPEYNIILGFKLASASLSLIGSLFIVTIYIYLSIKYKCKKKRTSLEFNGHPKNINVDESNRSDDYKKLKLGYGHDLIFHLSLADLILSISAFINFSGFEDWSGLKSDIPPACIIQGILSNYAEISSICWATIISLSIYLGTVTTNANQIKNILFYSYFYSYGIPILLTICPLFTSSYGPAGAWCWLNVRNSNDPAAWTWSLAIYIFNWINILFNIFAVVKTIHYFRIRAFEVEETDNEQANFLRNFCIVLKFFPIIQIICWIFPTINRIFIFVSNTENTGLYVLHGFFGFLMGFLNCIIYSYYFRTNLPCWFCFKSNMKSDLRASVKFNNPQGGSLNGNGNLNLNGNGKERERERDNKYIQNISELEDKSPNFNKDALKNNKIPI